MPSYIYQCPECEDRLETILTYEEFERKRFTCPKCKKRMKKVLFAPPFHSRLSLMHPRHMRGQRGKHIVQEGNVMQ